MRSAACLLLVISAVMATGTRAEAAPGGPLAREVERACEDSDAWVGALRGRNVAEQLACLAEQLADAPPEEADTEEKAWAFDLTGYWTSKTPDDDAYGQAILRADRGALHLEARYNYEDFDTGSLFAGWTFAWSGEVEFSLVPMVGAVFGHTQGVAPGLELDLVWKILEFYAEAEYVFDTDGRDESFFYIWSEFTANPTEWLSFGIVVQLTAAYQTDTEVDWGPLLGLHVGLVTATVYVFNLDTDDPYVMIGVGITF